MESSESKPFPTLIPDQFRNKLEILDDTETDHMFLQNQQNIAKQRG